MLLLPGAQAAGEVERTRAELTALGARVTAVGAREEAVALGAALDETIASWWAGEGPDGPAPAALALSA